MNNVHQPSFASPPTRYALLAVTDAGRTTTVELASQLTRHDPNLIVTQHHPVKAQLQRLWNLPDKDRPDVFVCCLALGAVVRLIAPLLESKHNDPVVLCVDERRQFVVVVTGAHHGGNQAATHIAGLLGAIPVVTTASDAVGLPDLDNVPGVVVDTTADCRASLMTRLLNNERLNLWVDPTTSITLTDVLAYLAPFRPVMVARPTAPGIAITHRVVRDTQGTAASAKATPSPVSGGCREEPVTDPDVTQRIEPAREQDNPSWLVGDAGTSAAVVIPPDVLVLVPPVITLGLGASRDCPAEELETLVLTTLDAHGIQRGAVGALATVDAKANEPAILALRDRFHWPLWTYPASDLATVPVPNPSDHALAAVGCASVSEAAALYHSQGTLLVEKTKSVPTANHAAAMATVAVALGSNTTVQRAVQPLGLPLTSASSPRPAMAEPAAEPITASAIPTAMPQASRAVPSPAQP